MQSMAGRENESFTRKLKNVFDVVYFGLLVVVRPPADFISRAADSFQTLISCFALSLCSPLIIILPPSSTELGGLAQLRSSSEAFRANRALNLPIVAMNRKARLAKRRGFKQVRRPDLIGPINLAPAIGVKIQFQPLYLGASFAGFLQLGHLI